MFRFAVATVALLVAVPAAANATFTVNFKGFRASSPSLAYNSTPIGGGSESLSVVATGLLFAADPATLTTLPVTPTNVQATNLGGLGIPVGNTLIDTNTPGSLNALLLTANKRFSIHSVTLANVDPLDTFQLYGVTGTGLTNLGFGTGNDFANSIQGLAAAACTTECLINFSPATELYSAYLFTTRLNGSVQGITEQGYRLAALTGALPEPGTWAMMIGGFGLAGASLRRQRKVATA
jgi:hypothetical protein